MSCNHLGGATLARAVAKADAKALAQAKKKSKAVQSREYAFFDAFSKILGSVPRRPVVSHEDDTQDAFGLEIKLMSTWM